MNEVDKQSIAQQAGNSPALVGNDMVSKTDVKPTDNVNVPSFSGINLFDEKQLVAAENFLTKIMRSDKGGIKSVNDGLAVLMRAQDLKLPFSTCIEHIHVINGKTGIDIHIIKALLSKAGCTWRCTKDYQPLYEYTDGINVYVDGSFPSYVVRCNNAKDAEEKAKADTACEHMYVYPVKWYKDINGNLYKDYQLNTNKFGVALNRAQIQQITQSGKIAVYRVPEQPVDFVTEYEITRNVNGKEVNCIGRFSYLEAQAAGLFDKDTYKKYPRVLISHRAFTLAARDIASDILFGVMETTELKIISGKELNNEELIQFEEVEEVRD